MNFELYIENLGAIEKAEMTINPLTILAGENGTGKSFVTKFLYSVLNVLMQDFYKIELTNILNIIEKNNNQLKETLDNDLWVKLHQFVINTRHKISTTDNIFQENFETEELELSNIFQNYLDESENIAEKLIELLHNSDFTVLSKASKNIPLIADSSSLLANFKNAISQEKGILKVLESYITSEIKSNFQISNLKQLIKKDKENLIFEIKNLIKIEIQENELKITQYDSTRNDIKNINRLVFFESPIYWRLSRDLIENSHQPKTYYLSSEINDERLTGIPKHFLDLRELVFANFKHGERPKFIEQCADDLQKHLNGKFNTDSYDLSFETNQGQPIVKNLVSFGMTNLGIIQAVLSKNIINKGSFVFIDEPESNLHPEWQAVLADILVKLAENGVFVVITTHSSDMLKALDVISQEHKQHEYFTSVNYFEKGGILAELNQHDISTVQQARLKLLETYDDLVLRGYLV